MPLAEQQAEWIGDLLTGRCSLPPRDAMLGDIERAQTAMRHRYVRSERHTIQVDFYSYLAELKQARCHNRRAIDRLKPSTAIVEAARRAA